jgi:hypothetical protein
MQTTDQIERTDSGSVDTGASDRSTTTSERTAHDRRRSVRLLYPEYGPVEALVGFGAFYLILEWMTPTLVDTLAGPLPDLVPDPLTTLTAMLLWLILGIIVAAIVLEFVGENPREFEDRSERDAYLDEHRPSDRDYRHNLALMVLGGATAVLSWSTAIEVLRGTFPVVVELGGVVPPGQSLADGAVFVVFFVGVAAYARGLDRLVVGGMREFLYRYHADDWE